MRVFVIGLAGTIGSGKGTVKDAIKKNFDCYQVSLSSAIRGEIEKKKRGFSRKMMQDMGDELRQKYGTFVLAKVSTEFMPRDKSVMIVDGIRNPGEAEWLKKTYKNDFVLLGVDAPQQTRFERVQKRARDIDPKTWDEFVQVDERDQGKGEPAYGQQVRKCIDAADLVIQNDSDVPTVESQLQGIFDQVRQVQAQRAL